MRHALLLAALLAPSAVTAADPAIVFQTQPAERVLGDFRAVTQLAAGDKAVKEFNEELKRLFGEKGLDGLDLSRPVVGYSLIAPKLEQSATVFVLPITNEKDFLALCERANKQKPKPLPGGLFELPKSEFADKAMMRVVDAHAYICLANDPAPHLDPKALVPANTLYDPAELALACGKVYPDRLPKELKAMASAGLADAKKLLDGQQGNFGAQELLITKVFGSAFLKLAEQGLAMSDQVKEVAVRQSFDAAAADMTTELRVTPKAGTILQAVIATRAAGSNRFGGLFGADTVGGFKLSLPLFTEDIRAAVATGLDEFKKEATKQAGPNSKPAAEELLNGMVRAAKAGEWDTAGVVRGPDKAGMYTLALAMSFEDGAAFEKAFRKFVEADAPPGEKDKFKWEVAKVGAVNVHQWAVTGNSSASWLGVFGGDKAAVAFAAGPKGLYLAIGADAVGTLKDVLAAKPAPSAAFDLAVNPARVLKMAAAIGDPQAAAQVEQVMGKEDKLTSALSLSVAGGADLRVTFKMHAKILPGTVYGLGRNASATFEKVEPGIKK